MLNAHWMLSDYSVILSISRLYLKGISPIGLFILSSLMILLDLEPASLGLAVLKLWARLFRTNTQCPFINVLRKSLEE